MAGLGRVAGYSARVAVNGFPSPNAAIAAIVDCIAGLVDDDELHTGFTGTGENLDCCPRLLRVEHDGFRARDGAVALTRTGCRELVGDVVITYAECFRIMTEKGLPIPIAELTAKSNAMTAMAWQTMETLTCCHPTNQRLRFVDSRPTPIVAPCAGWTIRLEVTLVHCGCPA